MLYAPVMRRAATAAILLLSRWSAMAAVAAEQRIDDNATALPGSAVAGDGFIAPIGRQSRGCKLVSVP